jgi:hypothetical protein
MDDELNILPLSSHIRSITQVPTEKDSEGLSEAERDLKSLKEDLSDDFPVGPLIKKCCTLDQVQSYQFYVLLMFFLVAWLILNCRRFCVFIL